ncbi:MAG: hypothetical protein WCL38_00680 [Actinomycetota bacterium]
MEESFETGTEASAGTIEADPRIAWSRRAWVAWGLVPPLLAWLFLRVIVTVASPKWVRPWSFSAVPWTRIDAFNYLAIANSGRHVAVCGPRMRILIPDAYFCGTAGWLPGYPYLLRGTGSVLSVSHDVAGVLLSNLAALAVFMVIWRGLLWTKPPMKALLVLGLLASFPGAVYAVAVFPISMATLGIAISIVALKKGHPLIAVLGMTLATFTYPSAVYALPALFLGLWWTLDREAPMAKKIGRLALGGIAVLPYVQLVVHDQLVFHRWNLYLEMQRGAGTALLPPKNPLALVWHLVVKQDTLTQILQGRGAAHWIAVQFIVATVLAAGAGLLLWTSRRNGLDLIGEAYPVLLGISIWLGVFLSGVGGGWYRSIALAAPLVLIGVRTRVSILWTALLVTTITTICISPLFFSRLELWNG